MIRLANISDVNRIAEIDVYSSRFAYHDIVAEEILFKETLVRDRIMNFEKWIQENSFSIYVFEDEKNQVIKVMMGFGKTFDSDMIDSFELHFIYVDPFFIRNGIGSKMIKFFEEKAFDIGFKELIVWVLEENKIGINFYLNNEYCLDGCNKIFKRFNKNEIRLIKKLT